MKQLAISVKVRNFVLLLHFVAWKLIDFKEGQQLKDSYEYYGSITNDSNLNGIGYVIDNIQSSSGQTFNGKVRLLSLRSLIEKTFKTTFTTPPQPKFVGQSKKIKK